MDQRLWIPLEDPTIIGRQADPLFLIAPDDWAEGGPDLDGDSQFFLKFAGEGSLLRFAGVNFPAGKLPFPSKVLPRRAETGKQLSLGI